MNERVRQLREYLNLSQTEFSSKVNIGRSTLSMFESGQRDLKDIHISQICSAFNVNVNWLRTGKGEMFETVSSDELDKLAKKHNLNPLAKKIVETFITLEDSEMNFLLNIVERMASSINDEVAAAKDDEDDIEKEMASYRLELEAEKKGKTSEVLGSGRNIS